MKKKFGFNKDIVTGIVVLLFSAFAYYSTFEFAQPENPWTAESFPQLVIKCMAVLGLIILIGGVLAGKGEKKAGNRMDLVRVGITALAAVIYLAIMPHVGFIIATILMLTVALICNLNKNKKTIILVSVLSPIAIYAVFYYLLNVRLP